MARSFSINFTHNNKPYMAVVSQLQSSVCVYIPDPSLRHLIPQGRFSFDTEQGLAIDATAISPKQNLMLDVLAAIESQPTVQPINNV